MVAARFPYDETARMQALRSLNVPDSAPEREFDALAQAAAAVCCLPISLISLVAEQRQWFKAKTGLLGVSETSRDLALCARAILVCG